MIEDWSTFREHHLFYIKLMLVERIVTGSHNFESILNFVSVQIDKHSAMSDVIGRDFSIKISIIVVSEWRKYWGSIKMGEAINAFHSRMVKSIDLSQNLSHSTSGILRIFHSCFSYFRDKFRFFKNICKSLFSLVSFFFFDFVDSLLKFFWNFIKVGISVSVVNVLNRVCLIIRNSGNIASSINRHIHRLLW